ncbi:PQQ-dependent sugar dehydrogenase [Leptospira sp. 96542]|nr:PQQ-dependent sugar dehydrogenase [Leptospira sp. 96542]
MNKFKYLILILSMVSFVSCEDIGRTFMKTFSRKYETTGDVLGSKPIFISADVSRKQVSIALQEVVKTKEPTDIQFPPGDSPFLFVLEKSGNLILFDRQSKVKRVLHTWVVLTDSEEGLLGLSFHPSYPKEPKAYVNYVKEIGKKDHTVVSEILIQNPSNFEAMKVTNERVLLSIEQPYPNHNAGQLVFGPDGFLYIGLGDGGLRADPKANGQNPSTLLGSMLRIDTRPDIANKREYSIPKDNPFIGKKGHKEEIFAYGIRNPWRFSFAPDGRLVVADVGQDKYEELDILEAGKNYGWNQTEGFHCFIDDCNVNLYTKPFYEYGREEGQSITGGYVYTGSEISELKGKYVFGDFIQGKIWALTLPKPGENGPVTEVMSLGKWNLLISTFGRDAEGDLFVADYQTGKIFKIVKP